MASRAIDRLASTDVTVSDGLAVSVPADSTAAGRDVFGFPNATVVQIDAVVCCRFETALVRYVQMTGWTVG